MERTDAPGLYVFFPAVPLQSGAEVEVTWSWSMGTTGRRIRNESKFRTR